ncbi:NAC domain-containing protein 53-like [Zingiber officinale]|uniref:NAC domain-containing protein 53-like n=1 Tax=Zingiber officinale TaxID=94328 RepID=UPI001C4C15B9|nr:NAC domain-containing protein 53-like [Zingiber officinale]
MRTATISSAPAPTRSAALLAPGFRFHPTDEELVSYYLRRRVCRRALRVDAIAEVDLYKCEPWELPGLSRLRSRDLEWYFFSPLDRKYSSRSRTNRATAQGYWKTTGKDRAVSRGARVVGMKKTLVYHSGRAPRGTRTNWVMHEYRLDDAELAQSEVPQDSYVVCRVFQKSGAGPQNGAQYGAPFVEEDWEEEEANGVVLMLDVGDDDAIDVHDQNYVEYNDLLQGKETLIQQDTAVLHTNGQASDNDQEDPTILLDEILKDQSFMEDVFACLDQTNSPGDPTDIDDSREQILLKDLSHNAPSQSDEYVELNDLENDANKNWNFNEGYASFAPNFVAGDDENSKLYKGIETEFLEFPDQCSDHHKLFQNVQVEDDLSFFAKECDIGEQDQDLIVDDAFFPSKALSSSFEFTDDIDKFFDAMDNDLPCHCTGVSEQSENLSSLSQANIKVEGGKSLANKGITELALTNVGADTLSTLPVSDYGFKNKNEDIPAAVPDMTASKESNNTIRSRLINMLGSISGPPALAAESHASIGKNVGQISGTYQPNEFYISPALIHLQDTSREKGNAGLLLSYSLPDNNASGKLSGFRPFRKIQDLAVSLLLQGSCYPLFLSALVLTVSYKVGMFIYDKN